MMDLEYDVIVVGAGHAGSEAAAAAANLGVSVLLITMDMTKIAQMSCNPAIGGIAKGQIVREIDALGGYTGIVTDYTTIQFRMLNRSKGPAVWSPRAQNDRMDFSTEWRKILESIPNLYMWQDIVESLIIEDKTVKGVKTKVGVEFRAKTVILTNGTFLNGLIHIGKTQIQAGRISEPASLYLSDQIKELGFEGVPALLLQRRGEVVGSEGLEAVTNMLSSCDLQSREDRTVLEDSREGLGAVCVPQRCQ